MHRYVDWEVSIRQYGDAACGADQGGRSSMSSNVDCIVCLAITPSLQLLGVLEGWLNGHSAGAIDQEVYDRVTDLQALLERGLHDEPRP